MFTHESDLEARHLHSSPNAGGYAARGDVIKPSPAGAVCALCRSPNFRPAGCTALETCCRSRGSGQGAQLSIQPRFLHMQTHVTKIRAKSDNWLWPPQELLMLSHYLTLMLKDLNRSEKTHVHQAKHKFAAHQSAV